MKKFLALVGLIALGACASDSGAPREAYYSATPTVDYVERLDVYSAPQKDSFLNQLAMNYRSFAIHNARKAGQPELGEVFAQKSVVAFSGETPFPESIENWDIQDNDLGFELKAACMDLTDMLKRDMSDYCPIETAEAQAKFDCWLTASATGQTATANECRTRFLRVMDILRAGGPNIGCGVKKPEPAPAPAPQPAPAPEPAIVYYPETVVPAQMRAREGVVIVNNVNIPRNLIRPEPVRPIIMPEPPQPIVFNQNIYGGDKSIEKTKNSNNTISEERTMTSTSPSNSHNNDLALTEVDNRNNTDVMNNPNMVSRAEFIEMMLMMREEIAAINRRLDGKSSDMAVLKVQQIPLEPKQHIMEEIFEVRFDFDKYKIKPEYEDVIRKLVQACQENRNMKISVIGHTDTVGSSDYNFALGGRRAKAVRDMLVQYGIPADQIVIVSSGKNDLKVQTGDQVKNAENRRVRVIKEQRYIEQSQPGDPEGGLEYEMYSEY
ncbi:MAG: OmpA family protein [Alphaproteobacteria bacterium]|nr:OmpA family protein [Alphaproteobacteria bacterium]